MVRKILITLFSVLNMICAMAQSESPAENKTAEVPAFKKILLVPYSPMLHLSDADQHIGEYSEKTGAQVRAAFRFGLTSYVKQELEKKYEVASLLTNTYDDEEKFLRMIYGSVNYRMDTVYPVSHPMKDTTKKSFLAKKSSVKEIRDLKYMNVTMSHKELLEMLSDKTGADLILFLNQFEIITNSNDCLDFALKIYRRQLKVHYSMYDPKGNQLYGDVAIVDFPSNSNDLTEIMSMNFPKIAEYISKTVPTTRNTDTFLSELKTK